MNHSGVRVQGRAAYGLAHLPVVDLADLARADRDDVQRFEVRWQD